MKETETQIRILYSFPNKLGATRICYTAWQQVIGLAAAGADVTVFTGGLLRPVPPGVKVYTTLARGKLRIPYTLIGNARALRWHDYLVSRQLENMFSQIDLIHCWPMGALKTLQSAAQLGIPTVLERCNAHTRFAISAVKNECESLGINLPRGHEHGENPQKLKREEAEYRLASRLLCPSDFVKQTFWREGFPEEKLARHQYGFDEKVYHSNEQRDHNQPLTLLFVGGCAPRKGLHYALEAWLLAPARLNGRFLIAGEFVPGYREKLSTMLSHPSVQVLGHRTDVAELMRSADILILPSVEEGSALVTYEARGSGCVLLVSEAAGAVCRHMEDALVHQVGDIATLTKHMTMLHEDRELLKRLRIASLSTAPEITWTAAGRRLLDVYQETIAMHSRRPSTPDHAVCTS
jgi:glycosyltransferase involved in cell wall biosynthesis